jgi:hypothetical protein
VVSLTPINAFNVFGVIMYTKWTSHLTDPEEKTRFTNKILSSRSVLERLSTILNEQEKELDRIETDPRIYEIPNWEYRQADNNGYRRCLSILKKLINLDQQENK